MLLQAAAHKPRTCLREDRRQEREACSLSRCACPYRDFSKLVTQHAGSIWLRTAKFTSCHTALVSIRKTVFVAAMNQDASQHGVPSGKSSAMAHTFSNKVAEPKNSESEAATTNDNTNFLYDSVAIGSKKLTERLTGLKTWWKAVHNAYEEDTATWGYGTSPIFRVYLGSNGQIEGVSIDEEEIKRRQNVEGFIPGLDSIENKEQAQEKILLARSIAKDLELGKRDFNRHSTVFSVEQYSSIYVNLSGNQKLLKQIDITVQRAAPFVKWTLMIGIPLYGIFILCGAYLLATKRSETDLNNEEKSAARLEKMRNLKAQMSTHKGNTSVVQPSLAPSEFMQKILEVREMARKVRSEEGVQKPVKDHDDNAEEYQPEVSSSLVTSASSVRNNLSTEHGGDFDTDLEDYQPEVQCLSDNINQPVSEDVGMTESNANVTRMSTRKVRPRIITSLDEAMAILGTEQADVGVSGGVFYDGKSQSDSKCNNAGQLIESLALNDSDSVLGELGSCEEDSQVEVERILVTNSGEQGTEDQSMERFEGEGPFNNVKSKLDQPYVGTLHDIDIKGFLTEVQRLEPRLNSASENGRLDESEAITNGDQVEQISDKDHSDKVSAQAMSSIRIQDSVSSPVTSMEPDEVVGSGQPLHKKVGSGSRGYRGPIFSNTKRWSKELQRKYDLERDPEIRELMREIGSELDSWVTEAEIEETARLAEKLEEGDDESVKKNYRRIQKKIKEEKERFGLDAVLEKYKEYQPKAADEFWWLDLRCVLCLIIVNREGEGLYGLDMTIDDEGTKGPVARHVVGFEDRKDASNFCRLLELRSSSRFRFAEVRPFSPKKLLEVSKEEGFRVTVLRSGQIQTHVDETLEEVEDKILEIGRSVYWDKLDREHSIDIDSILHQRFGL